ncbi:MAG: tetratricopeptide repeat protein, partial [Myxococcota bacterium]
MNRTSVFSAARRAVWVLGCVALIATGCGGSSSAKATSPGADDSSDPGKVSVGSNTKKPARKISRDAKRDYMEAVDLFKKQSAAGWSAQSCNKVADKFIDVSKSHSKLVEARYMAGLAYHRCGMSAEAEKQYQRALEVDRAHARSMSNLGELAFQA